MIRRSILCLFLLAAAATGQTGGQLRFCLRAEPKTFNPILVDDQYSETIRYLTGGVLIRLNRRTQNLEPELALSWKTEQGGRKIIFRLRPGLRFSDGTPFTAEDVAYTLRALLDPKLHSPSGDAFRSGSGAPEIRTLAPDSIAITFPSPIAALDRQFDQVAILSSRSPRKEMAVLGPFRVAGHKPGAYVLLERNPNYWKRDEQGTRLPYLDSVRLDIQQNRDIELLRFRRAQLHLINTLDPESFDRLAAESPSSVHDAGASLDSELLWFNQAPAAPIPAYKKAWFGAREFRRALSSAINREDLCRLVYRGHARSAAGPVSPGNRYWFRDGLEPHRFDPAGALRELERAGFRRSSVEPGRPLLDRDGHRVEFSVITNAGNKARERMAVMIQQDLEQLGIRLNVVTLDLASLLERISRTSDYESCLLGLTNDDLDPNAQMNVWLSSASNHQWNPNQKSPQTAWESEIDRLMRAQASTADPKRRKLLFDRVQEIVWEQAPFLYLVHKNSLSAVSPSLRNVSPAALRPQTYWNAERLSLRPGVASQ
jgi:peptide/nickel transport system substrate-binding protein